MISDDPFWLSCCSTCIKIIKRMIRIDYNGAQIFSSFLNLAEIELVFFVGVFWEEVPLEYYGVEVLFFAIG